MRALVLLPFQRFEISAPSLLIIVYQDADLDVYAEKSDAAPMA